MTSATVSSIWLCLNADEKKKMANASADVNSDGAIKKTD